MAGPVELLGRLKMYILRVIVCGKFTTCPYRDGECETELFLKLETFIEVHDKIWIRDKGMKSLGCYKTFTKLELNTSRNSCTQPFVVEHTGAFFLMAHVYAKQPKEIGFHFRTNFIAYTSGPS